jgi:hypothetical protein
MMRETTATAHPFEAAGLGKAPFRFEGMTENVVRHPDGTTQAGGSCDYCSTGIRYECRIVSADGVRSKVGCDCILKLDRDDNKALVMIVEAKKAAIEREQRAARKAARLATETARIVAALARLDASESLRSTLAAMPHPTFADSTMLAYVEWMRHNAGHSGMLKVAKIIDAIPADGPNPPTTPSDPGPTTDPEPEPEKPRGIVADRKALSAALSLVEIESAKSIPVAGVWLVCRPDGSALLGVTPDATEGIPVDGIEASEPGSVALPIALTRKILAATGISWDVRTLKSGKNRGKQRASRVRAEVVHIEGDEESTTIRSTSPAATVTGPSARFRLNLEMVRVTPSVAASVMAHVKAHAPQPEAVVVVEASGPNRFPSASVGSSILPARTIPCITRAAVTWRTDRNERGRRPHPRPTTPRRASNAAGPAADAARATRANPSRRHSPHASANYARRPDTRPSPRPRRHSASTASPSINWRSAAAPPPPRPSRTSSTCSGSTRPTSSHARPDAESRRIRCPTRTAGKNSRNRNRVAGQRLATLFSRPPP